MAVPRRYLAARLANLLPRRNKIAGTVLRLSGRPCTHKLRAGANRPAKGDADRLPNRPRRAIASRPVRAPLSRPLRSPVAGADPARQPARSEEHTSDIKSLLSISLHVFCFKK